MPEDWPFRLTAFAGFCLIPLLAWITGDRERVDKKTVVGSLVLIWAIGFLTFWLPWSKQALEWINGALVAVLDASQKGTVFLFGPLAMGPGQTLPDGTASVGFILAIQVLPSVIFFSAVVAGLYYLNVMQVAVRFFARIFYRTMRLSGAESLAAAANIFVGVESSLTVRPYLNAMTRSELLTLLTCMMATVASTVMAVYVLALKDVFPQIAGHLVSASVISIPCAILISKVSLPETKVPATLSDDNFEAIDHASPLDTESNASGNLITALIDGGAQGVRMAVGIATLLIVVLGLEAVVDLVLGLLPGSLSLAGILGWLTWPFAVLLGLRPEEWQLGAEILGARFIEGEVPAYFSLASAQAATPPAFSLRSLTALTYALCGFVHIASMGIFVGGLAALVPDRVKDLSLLGLRALWTSFLATFLTGCVAGILS
jgi:concentrative nucleoside transporter, CNT family